MPRKRGGILSKKIIKTDAAAIANTINQGLVADLTVLPKTPNHVSFSLPVPQTAPSKMENFRVYSSSAVEASEKVPDFTVWEDHSLEDGVVAADSEKILAVEEEDSDDQEYTELPEPVDETKENKPPLGGLGGSFGGVSAGSGVADTSGSRHALSDLKVGGMQEYQDLIGKAFKIACSPKSLFYRGRPVACSAMPAAATIASPSVFKFPFPGIPYSKDLPPPSKLTRTHGSEHFRVTSVNLFNKSASASTSSMKKKESLFMDSLSPSTPHKLPDHIHGSRLHKRRVFPQVKLFALDGGSGIDQSIPFDNTDSKVKANQETPSLGSSFLEPVAMATSITEGIVVSKDPLQPSPPASYNLRPRTRNGGHGNPSPLPALDVNSGLPPLGNNSLTVIGPRKKLRKQALA